MWSHENNWSSVLFNTSWVAGVAWDIFIILLSTLIPIPLPLPVPLHTPFPFPGYIFWKEDEGGSSIIHTYSDLPHLPLLTRTKFGLNRSRRSRVMLEQIFTHPHIGTFILHNILRLRYRIYLSISWLFNFYLKFTL